MCISQTIHECDAASETQTVEAEAVLGLLQEVNGLGVGIIFVLFQVKPHRLLLGLTQPCYEVAGDICVEKRIKEKGKRSRTEHMVSSHS